MIYNSCVGDRVNSGLTGKLHPWPLAIDEFYPSLLQRLLMTARVSASHHETVVGRMGVVVIYLLARIRSVTAITIKQAGMLLLLMRLARGQQKFRDRS